MNHAPIQPDQSVRTLGQVIRDRMDSAGISLRVAAASINTPHTTLYRHLQDDRHLTSEEVRGLADVLGCKASDLMAEAEAA